MVRGESEAKKESSKRAFKRLFGIQESSVPGGFGQRMNFKEYEFTNNSINSSFN